MLTYWLHRHISVCHLHSMTPLQLEYIRKVKSLLSAVITRTLVTPHLFVWPDTGYQFCGDNRSAVTVYLLLPFNCSFKCFFYQYFSGKLWKFLSIPPFKGLLCHIDFNKCLWWSYGSYNDVCMVLENKGYAVNSLSLMCVSWMFEVWFQECMTTINSC